MFKHFKVKYDQILCSEDGCERICGDLYDRDQKYLVVLEKSDTNAHCHFQGFTHMPTSVFENTAGEFFRNHKQKQFKPNSRPVSHVKREADDLGFQYMMKEDVPKVLATNFTPEELEDLAEKSKAYKEDYSKGAFKRMMECEAESPTTLHKKMRKIHTQYHIEKKLPINTTYSDKSVTNAMDMKTRDLEEDTPMRSYVLRLLYKSTPI